MEEFRLKSKWEICFENNHAFLVNKFNRMYRIPISKKIVYILCLLDGRRSIDYVLNYLTECGVFCKNRINVIKRNFENGFCVFLDRNSKVRYNSSFLENTFPSKIVSPIIDDFDFPRFINYYITSNCRLGCMYCYLKKVKAFEINKKSELSTEQIYSMLREFEEMGVGEICYIGGEPFERKDFFDIIQYTSDLGIHSTIVTKHVFSDKEVNALRNISNITLDVSLDTCETDQEEKIYGRKGIIYDLYNSMKQLSINNIDIRARPVIHKMNIDQFDKYIFYMREIGIKNILINRYKTTGTLTDQYFEIKDDEWMSFIDEAKMKYNDFYITTLNVDDTNLIKVERGCRNGKYAGSILWNGDIILCEYAYYIQKFGNLNENSFTEIWNNIEKNSLRYCIQGRQQEGE